MSRLSIEILNNRLRQTTWIPLSIMAMLFFLAMGFILQREHRSHIKSIHFALDEVIRSQQTQTEQEVLLGQIEGAEIRLRTILNNWSAKYPDTQACIYFRVMPPEKATREGGFCALEGDAKVALAPVQAEVIALSTGNTQLGEIRYAVIRPTTLLEMFPPILLAVLVLGLGISFFMHTILVRGVEKRVLSPLLNQMKQDERDRAIASTTRMLAHDIRKPFQLVQIALVHFRDSKHPEVKALANRVSEEIERSLRSVKSMVRDILDVNRKMKPDLETISVGEVMEQLRETVLRLYPNLKTHMQFNFIESEMVVADPGQLQRILINLVDNAIEAAGETGTVKVSALEQEVSGKKQIEFMVHNNGPVIPKEDIEKIFAPYFTKKEDGTGLGLVITQKLIEEHGSKIFCSSNSEEGTCFSFALCAGSLQTENAEDHVLSGAFDKTILVFDDEQMVREHWAEFVKKHGFNVVLTFRSWEDFIARDGFDLVTDDSVAFVDLHFKGSRHNGVEISKALRQLGVRKVYAITADLETAQASGLFSEVFGKEVPTNLRKLIG